MSPCLQLYSDFLGWRDWKRVRRFRWLGAVFSIWLNDGLNKQHIEWIGRPVGSLWPGGTIVYWLPKPYVIEGSIESDFIETICGSGEATEHIVIVCLDIAPDSCGINWGSPEYFPQQGYFLLMSAPHKKRPVLWTNIPKREVGSSHQLIRDEVNWKSYWPAKIDEMTSRSDDIKKK